MVAAYAKKGSALILVLSLAAFLISGPTLAQTSNDQETKTAQEKAPPVDKAKTPKKPQIKPFEEVITEDAKSDAGLFTVHLVEDKLYYEIPNDMLEREMLLVSRIARTATQVGYGGEKANTQVVRWQRHEKKILLRIVTYVSVADENLPIYEAVKNANLEPIVQSFEIAAFGKDKQSVVIEVTGLFTKDVPFLGLTQSRRQSYKVKKLDTTRSFLVSAKSYPKNIEIKNILTYDATEPPSNPSLGAITLEMNHSMILLPEEPMQPRRWDERVGYFSVQQTDYGVDAQKAVQRRYITRWRLEPKDPAAFARGKLVEPVKPIVFYIDPATPLKWRPYIKKGVEDWKIAYEAAGFKNAILAKDPPSPREDPEFSPEDVRYSVIRYFPSEVMNAYGPHVHDPRSGEILESDIGLYHNVLNLLRNWYFVQTAAANPEARGIKFDDKVMGKLLRYVVAHEVGHTLGLPHNMMASSTFPVEKLRSKAFTDKMGSTSSIMDYARFNYVAQPGDGVTNFVPKIGPYDIYSIRWGYRPIPEAKSAEAERSMLDKWILEKYDDPIYRFNDGSSYDPTSQSEAVGDDPVKASEYGIANLTVITQNLIKWTYQPREDYSQLRELYGQITDQWNRYMGHVVTTVGGIYKTRKTTDQKGPVYEIIPKQTQQNAMHFLAEYALKTPAWMINVDVLDRIEHAGIVERIRGYQVRTVNRILDFARLQRLIESEARLGEKAYGMSAMFHDLHGAVWSELAHPSTIDVYRRNLQRGYIDRLEYLMTQEPQPIQARYRAFIERTEVNVSQSDIRAYVRGELEALKDRIPQVEGQIVDKATRLHLRDIAARIDKILNPCPGKE
ncbi:MAG: DUF5117 domain-containing protein [Candidatus Aminicenantes bacterium]|nr:DUF5117 domain-containing protein [Candidatus Aminicenantes bacterium]